MENSALLSLDDFLPSSVKSESIANKKGKSHYSLLISFEREILRPGGGEIRNIADANFYNDYKFKSVGVEIQFPGRNQYGEILLNEFGDFLRDNLGKGT